MWFILQMAVGVCGGLWLFSIVKTWSFPRIDWRLLLTMATSFSVIVWVIHLILMAFRDQ